MPLAYYTPEQNALSCTPSNDVFKQVVNDLMKPLLLAGSG
jgi:hypothetical protein